MHAIGSSVHRRVALLLLLAIAAIVAVISVLSEDRDVESPQSRASHPADTVAAVPILSASAEPESLIPAVPPLDTSPGAATSATTVGPGSLEAVLLDTWGDEVALGAYDSLKIDRVAPPDGKRWFREFFADSSGHVFAPQLDPGLYNVELNAGIAETRGLRSLEIRAGEPTRISFRHQGPVLSRRITVRILGLAPDAPAPPAASVILHGNSIAASTLSYGQGLYWFDDVPPGLYDLEIRADATQSRWLSRVEPGTRQETWFDLSRLQLEPGSQPPAPAKAGR